MFDQWASGAIHEFGSSHPGVVDFLTKSFALEAAAATAKATMMGGLVNATEASSQSTVGNQASGQNKGRQ